MVDNGFTSLAGEDDFHSHFAFIVNEYLEEKFPGRDSILVELFRFLNVVNDFFSCAGGGGTLYGHMEAQISALIEEMMLSGLKSGYETKMILTDNIWKERLIDIIDLSYGGNPDEILKKCYEPLAFKETKHKDWIKVQVYFYLGDYIFGP